MKWSAKHSLFVDSGGVSPRRRIAYASAFLDLGLINAASDELEAIRSWARISNDVLAVRVELYASACQWDKVEAIARALTRTDKERERPWIALEEALFRQRRLAEACDALRKGEIYHARSGPYYYELARYYGLLENSAEARRHLARAFLIDRSLARRYQCDPDFDKVRSRASMRFEQRRGKF